MTRETEDPRAELAGVLHDLAREIGAEGNVEVGTMFRSPGLRVHGRILAFLGFDGGLIVKLPRDRGQELVEGGAAAEVVMGTRTMKEWFELPAAGTPATNYETWLPRVREALEFVRQE